MSPLMTLGMMETYVPYFTLTPLTIRYFLHSENVENIVKYGKSQKQKQKQKDLFTYHFVVPVVQIINRFHPMLATLH